MTRVLCGVALVLALAAPVSAAPGASASARTPQQMLEAAQAAISELRLSEAERLLERLPQAQKGAAPVLFERARLEFYRGRYPEAVALAEQALAGARGPERKSWLVLHQLMGATRAVTRDFERMVGGDGRYDVLYPAGKDAVLARAALSVLQRADQALQRVFGQVLPGPIRLEIYDAPSTLAQVSALTVEQIETTGTVALSKWNRLMITSPKALVRGYPWADTIAHELVHLWVSKLTGDRAPVWLQEGTAKLLERSWRGQDAGLLLDPAARGLLVNANEQGKLLTFEQMHPSIAMLPSEDLAALAFAQVSTFMQRYVEQHHESSLREALSQIERGVDARQALGSAAGVAFAKLEVEWKTGLPTDAEAPAPRLLKSRFRVGDGPSDESAEVQQEQARKHLRIGDMLWDRGRAGAAAHQYEKAFRADRGDPIVASRWARAALQSGNAHAAVEALEPQLERYPSHAPTHALLGAARLALGERALAAQALREALWINPFDPAPHCDLARATDDPTEAARAQNGCEALR